MEPPKVSPPLSASLLTTTADRKAFAEWLDRVRRLRGLSKKALGRAISQYDSAYAINKWLAGEVFPRRETLERIAGALSVSRAVVYMRAGYPQLLIKALPKLHELGVEQMRHQNVIFDPEWLGVLSDDLPDDGLGYRHLAFLDEKYAWVPVAIPLPIYDAFLFAVGSFARRGDYYSQHDVTYDFQAVSRMGAILDEVSFDFTRPGNLPNPLSLALEILDKTYLKRELRLQIAGELTLDWAFNLAPKLTELILRLVFVLHADQSGIVLPTPVHSPGVMLSEWLSGRCELHLTHPPIERSEQCEVISEGAERDPGS